MFETTRTLNKKKVWLSPDFVRAMLAGHSALGLGFAALIYIVCLTGTVAVFLHDFRRWEQPDTPQVTSEPTPAALQKALIDTYQKSQPKAEHPDIFIAWNGELSPQLSTTFHDHETHTEGDWLADDSGNLATEKHAPWSEFVATLHVSLHLPSTWGLFIVGLTGVALLSSLISGLLAHPRIFKDAFAFRRGGSIRLQEADLHNRLGVWGLPFHIAVSLTGALLGLSVLIVGVLALAAYDGDSEKAFAEVLGPRAGNDHSAAELPDIADMIARVRLQHPEVRFANVLIQHAGTAGQIIHLGMSQPGYLAFSNNYYFDANGELIGDAGLENGSVGQQILGALQSLHFGWFGGMAIKLAYGLLGAALTVVTHSGVTIWLARRRDKGHPAGMWERIWAGIIWGQLLALVVTACVAVLLATPPLVLIYLLITFAALLCCLALRTAGLCKLYLSALTAAALAFLVVAHISMWGFKPQDGRALLINAVLAMSAIAVATVILRIYNPASRQGTAVSD